MNEFLKVFEAFHRKDVNYILIGGVAMNIHGFGRATGDIDIFVTLVPENLDKLRQALYSIYKDDSVEEITSEELDNYAVIRYGTPKGFLIVPVRKLIEMKNHSCCDIFIFHQLAQY